LDSRRLPRWLGTAVSPIGKKDLIIVHVGDDGVSFATRQIVVIQKIVLCFVASAGIMHSLYSIF
jgi:hypothetical protein